MARERRQPCIRARIARSAHEGELATISDVGEARPKRCDRDFPAVINTQA